jgi:hypothetical protein
MSIYRRPRDKNQRTMKEQWAYVGRARGVLAGLAAGGLSRSELERDGYATQYGFGTSRTVPYGNQTARKRVTFGPDSPDDDDDFFSKTRERNYE